MVKRLRASLAFFIAAALVVLSPGLEAPRLFAQAIVRTVPVGIAPVAVVLSASPLAAPSVFAPASLTAAPSPAAPSAFAASPSAAPALTPAARAASVPEMAISLAPHLEAAAKPDTSASGAAAAGRGIEDVITGQRSAGSGDISSVMGAEGSGAASLALSAAASAPADSAKPGVPAAAVPAAGKTVDSAASYRVHRFLLKAIAKLTGGVYSLPVAGEALTRELIRSAANKSVVFSDYDATLADYSSVLPEDMVAAVNAIKAAGKTFVVISDRGDEPRKGQLTVFESLASLPVATRAGMYVAANSGGRVYRYDDKGEPVRVFEAPAPDAAEKVKLGEAVAATKARLKDIGAELHFPSEKNTVPTESWNVYSYAMMLKIGSDDAHVRGAADILTEEMAKRGYNVQVDPRYAKDPANPPYIVFSLVTKQTASAFISKALKAEPKDVLVIGDSMYTPGVPKNESWLTRLGEKLSGLALPRTGNRTDRNMELAIPGALTFSVGASGDPRASNLFVLAGRGPAVTLQVLRSVASKSRASGDAKNDSVETALHVGVAAAIIAATAASYYLLGHALIEFLGQAERQLRQQGPEFMNGGAMFGGVLGLAGVKAKIPASWKRNAMKALPVVGVAALLAAAAAGYYAMFHAFGEVFKSGASQFMPAGVEPLALTLGVAGVLGGGRQFLSNPSGMYGEARKKAIEIAAARGIPAEQVLFVRANSSMPVRDGAHWDYSFSIPGKNGGRALIYADTKGFLGGSLETRTSVFDNAPEEGDRGAALEAVSFRMGTKALDPEQAIDIARRAQPGMSAGVGVSLDYRSEPVSGGADLWYRFFDDRGAVVSVNARTSESRVDAAIGAKTGRWAGVKSAAGTIGLIAFTAGLYAAFYWAITHAPSAQSSIPAGWQGAIPNGWHFGSFFGGALGLLGLTGTIRAVKKAKVRDDEISAAAKGVVTYKGGVWSETEYNVGYYNAIDDFRKRGATEAQIAQFRKLCDAAPVIGGRFNPWAGD